MLLFLFSIGYFPSFSICSKFSIPDPERVCLKHGLASAQHSAGHTRAHPRHPRVSVLDLAECEMSFETKASGYHQHELTHPTPVLMGFSPSQAMVASGSLLVTSLG
jgi:hypothetical protein